MFDTSFEKKTLYGAILSLFLGLILVIYPFSISLAISDVFDINFESFEGYSTGDLNGQESWTAATTLDVSSVSDYVRSGSQGIISLTSGADTGTYGNAVSFNSSVGGIDWYSFSLKRHQTSTGFARIRMGNNETGFEVGFSRLNDNYDELWLTGAKINCETKEGLGGQAAPLYISEWTYQNSYGLPYNNWIDISLKFDLDDKLVWLYYKVGSSEWYAFSEENNLCFWINSALTDDDFFEVFGIYARRYTAIDYFYNEADICAVGGSCSVCETSEDCLSAGCVYEWNTGFERWECHQEWIPYVYGCGLGQCGCPDQTSCEAAEPVGTCEWVDRGYGEGCYEVVEAPPEVEWEMPELDSCEGLGTIETWLCEIKNFFAGIFMPTQEKVDDLKKTLDNFKTKFPFNYANSLSSFFNTIKTSFDTEKDIPIKVLGVESNVDFSFWDQNTTIGGVGETLKNVVFDFTTIFIVLSFFIWIISFIKRIF